MVFSLFSLFSLLTYPLSVLWTWISLRTSKNIENTNGQLLVNHILKNLQTNSTIEKLQKNAMIYCESNELIISHAEKYKNNVANNLRSFVSDDNGNVDNQKLYSIFSNKELMFPEYTINTHNSFIDPEDNLMSLYNSLSMIQFPAVFAGSNALSKYIKNLANTNAISDSDKVVIRDIKNYFFEPNDIDIFVTINDKEEFDKLADQIIDSIVCQDINISLIKSHWYPEKLKDRRTYVMQNHLTDSMIKPENFNLMIRGSHTFEIEGIGKVQFVCFPAIDDVINITDKVTDVPSCICYSVDINVKMMQFYVPSFFNKWILKTGFVPTQLICDARKEKYGKRGWKFICDQRISDILPDFKPYKVNIYNC